MFTHSLRMNDLLARVVQRVLWAPISASSWLMDAPSGRLLLSRGA